MITRYEKWFRTKQICFSLLPAKYPQTATHSVSAIFCLYGRSGLRTMPQTAPVFFDRAHILSFSLFFPPVFFSSVPRSGLPPRKSPESYTRWNSLRLLSAEVRIHSETLPQHFSSHFQRFRPQQSSEAPDMLLRSH